MTHPPHRTRSAVTNFNLSDYAGEDLSMAGEEHCAGAIDDSAAAALAPAGAPGGGAPNAFEEYFQGKLLLHPSFDAAGTGQGAGAGAEVDAFGFAAHWQQVAQPTSADCMMSGFFDSHEYAAFNAMHGAAWHG